MSYLSLRSLHYALRSLLLSYTSHVHVHDTRLKTVSLIFGTRPEAIKLAPVILELRKHPQLQTHVCVTAQHREMLDQVLDVFNISPDVDLDLMRPNQTLAEFVARALAALDAYMIEHKPDLVLVQGDTSTTFVASLAAFYHKIPIGHVEAGLRTGDRYAPFPEEINRTLTTHLADYHFAPTDTARANLLREGIPDSLISVTGNTVVDALMIAVEEARRLKPDIPGLPKGIADGQDKRPIVLITGHRRENFGPGFEAICRAIATLAERFPETAFIYPVHLNPNVREPVFRLLAHRENIHLIEPLAYLPFVALMDRCSLILTDSGGIQEEAPSLGKPVLVMREVTERPEAVEAGTARLVGADSDGIVRNVSALLAEKVDSGHEPRTRYTILHFAHNPYGDGHASRRITEALVKSFDPYETLEVKGVPKIHADRLKRGNL